MDTAIQRRTSSKEGLDTYKDKDNDKKTTTATTTNTTKNEVTKADLNLRTTEEERKKDILSGTNISAGLGEVFSKTTFLVLLLFVVVYYIAYVMIHRMKLDGGGEGGMPNTQNAISRTVDFVVIAIVLLLCVYYFANIQSDKATEVSSSNNDAVRAVLVWTRDFFENPANLVSLPLSIIVFYSVVYLCQIPMGAGAKPYTIAFIENKFWILLGLLVIFLIFKYGLGFSINAYMMNHLIYWWDHARKGDLFDKKEDDTNDKKTVAKTSVVTSPPVVDEVFNVSKNVYTYDDSHAVCSAMGARLATYDEVEKSYQDGGEWCNYGWSENQMILFPTQKKTWDKLQKVDGHHNDCGRPGINGGYIENPNARFGVNCFGKKPVATADDLTRLNAVSADAEFDSLTRDPIDEAKIKYWKDHSDTFLQVNSFNRSKWSEANGPVSNGSNASNGTTTTVVASNSST